MTEFHKSSFCGGAGACVEVGTTDDGDTLVRDSRGTVIAFGPEFAEFINEIKAGEHDRRASVPQV